MTANEELDAEAIRRRVDAYTGPDHYRYEVDGIEYDAHWAHDTRRLLDENARLNARIAELEELKCSVCGMRVAHLNCNGHVIGWGCADGEECRPAPEMPRPPAEELAAKVGEIQSDLDALESRRNAPPETSREYLQRMGAEFRANMARLKARDEADAERDRLAAQERAGDTNTSPAGSGRGTGVTEAPGSSRVIEFENSEIWAVDIEHPLLGDNIETEYLGETNGIHRWRLTNPTPGASSITFPSLPVPSTERKTP